jgi:RHS repeat-associated protein
MAYDGQGRMVKIVETTGGSITSMKQHIWCGLRRCEEREASNVLKKQLFNAGQRNDIDATPTSFFYSKDHLGSIRELTDSSGTVQAQYQFSPFGERTAISETVAADFSFTGHYLHSRSGLNLAPFRAYSASLGRWIRRDPLSERAGAHLFAYVRDRFTSHVDPLGVQDGPVCHNPDYDDCMTTCLFASVPVVAIGCTAICLGNVACFIGCVGIGAAGAVAACHAACSIANPD